MASTPSGEFENKVRLESDADKAEETQNEYQPDKAGSDPLVHDDAHTKAVTRSLLFKLDTRYAQQ